MFRVMQGGRLSGRRLFTFFVLTLWDYLKQGASNTILFTLFIVSCCIEYPRICKHEMVHKG